MTYKDTLYNARALIEDESRWTQGTLARNAEGVSVSSTSESAVCWCVAGAMEKVLHDCQDKNWMQTTVEYISKLNTLARKEHPLLQGLSIPTMVLNDTYGHESIIGLLDVAIQS